MRRFSVLAAAVVALVAMAGCWPAPGQGPDRRAHNDIESGFDATTVADFTERWTATTDETGPRGVGHPVLKDATVHVTTTRSVYAFSAATGAQQWMSGIDVLAPSYEEVDTDVFVWDDLLFTSVRMSGVDWHYVQCGAGPAGGSCTTLGGELQSKVETLRPAAEQAGALLSDFWEQPSGVSQSAQPFDGGPSVLVTEQANDSRLTLGTTQFFHAGIGVGTAPANGVRAFPRAGGAGWSTVIDGAAPTSPVLSAGEASVFVGTDAGTLYALATADGTILWSTPVGSAVTASPALADGVLYVPTTSGSLVAVSQADGTTLWSTAAGSQIAVQPAVAAGVVFTGSVDGSIQAYDAAGCGGPTCTAVWSDTTGSRITGAPAVSRGLLFVSTQDGQLVAYGLPVRARQLG